MGVTYYFTQVCADYTRCMAIHGPSPYRLSIRSFRMFEVARDNARSTHGETRTRNLLLRSGAPFPLGRAG